MSVRCLIARFSLMSANCAAGDVPYAVAEKPWDEGLGHHRAVLHVDAAAPAVLARIPWRRRDADPAEKHIIVVDAATGRTVDNVARLQIDRDAGVLAFAPATVPGDYHVYYLPYTPQAGWGGYGGHYLPPKDTADPAWKQSLPADPAQLPQAAVLRFEAREEFDSVFPMEVCATTAETEALLAAHPGEYLLFPEDRRFPIRMTGQLPLCWIRRGPSAAFQGEARRGEYYAFQIGVYSSGQALDNIAVEVPAGVTCFNAGGTNWDGRPVRNVLNVPRRAVQALWFGVDVADDAAPGPRSFAVTLRPANAPARTVDVTLNILPEELPDRGDGEPWRHSRLRWLDSTLGADDDLVAPYTPLVVEGRTIRCLGRSVELGDNGLPVSIKAGAAELLAGPVGFPGAAPGALRFTKQTPGVVEWEAGACRGRMEFDGHLDFAVTVVPPGGAALEIPFRRAAVPYFMGAGRGGGHRPPRYEWRWQGPYDSFWAGDVPAGLHVELRGGAYHGPMLNLYHPAPPAAWHNGGAGGVSLADDGPDRVLARAFAGHRAAGAPVTFEFALLVTPVKPPDPARHFAERYYHSGENVPPEVNILNIHHANVLNPFINYPFLSVERLREHFRKWQGEGRKVKIYYTVRELTNRVTELWALRSLGNEVLAGGPGGGFPWLREHLGGGYTPQWYTAIEGGGVDAAILTSGASRWYNYHIEGLNWLARNIPIDGLYLDDVSYDRTVLKRMRKVLERARPGGLIDLHSNTAFSIGPANQYAEFFPYVDRLWFGESFQYDRMTPDQWLVECSGIPFGLMGDMLQGGGNRWLGLVYGMTARLPWTGASDPRPVWKVWDDFGITGARMAGYWEPGCPVRTGRDLVKATAYVRDGRTLIALASWESAPVTCALEIDWKALGLDPAKAVLRAPEVANFQPSRQWKPGEPIPVDPLRGWLIMVE